nr:MAG TPA: hypothetical protein [Caudoviricetes sp.]
MPARIGFIGISVAKVTRMQVPTRNVLAPRFVIR